MRGTSSLDSFNNETGSFVTFWSAGDAGTETALPLFEDSLSSLGINVTIGKSFIDKYRGNGFPCSGMITAVMPYTDVVEEEDQTISYSDVTVSIRFNFYKNGRALTTYLDRYYTYTPDEAAPIASVNVPFSSFNAITTDDTACDNIMLEFYTLDYDEITFTISVSGTGTPEGGEEATYNGLAMASLVIAPIPNLG